MMGFKMSRNQGGAISERNTAVPMPKGSAMGDQQAAENERENAVVTLYGIPARAEDGTERRTGERRQPLAQEEEQDEHHEENAGITRDADHTVDNQVALFLPFPHRRVLIL